MSRLALGPTQLPIQWVLVALPGGEVARAWSRATPPHAFMAITGITLHVSAMLVKYVTSHRFSFNIFFDLLTNSKDFRFALRNFALIKHKYIEKWWKKKSQKLHDLNAICKKWCSYLLYYI
jgi:hypothetical protein